MKLLLDDVWAPMTTEIALIEASRDVTAAWWHAWEESHQTGRGVSIVRRELNGTLADMLRALLPLTSVEHRRILFVPTTSGWTAMFDNGWQGGDAAAASSAALKLGCHALRIVACPNSVRRVRGSSSVGRYGARMFEFYGPNQSDFLNYIRTIAVANDGGRWVFEQSGAALPFEDMAWYAPARVKDRFTEEQLALLLKRLGHDVFEESFYLREGTLLERRGPTAPGLREYSLEEVQAAWAT